MKLNFTVDLNDYNEVCDLQTEVLEKVAEQLYIKLLNSII